MGANESGMLFCLIEALGSMAKSIEDYHCGEKLACVRFFTN